MKEDNMGDVLNMFLSFLFFSICLLPISNMCLGKGGKMVLNIPGTCPCLIFFERIFKDSKNELKMGISARKNS